MITTLMSYMYTTQRQELFLKYRICKLMPRTDYDTTAPAYVDCGDLSVPHSCVSAIPVESSMSTIQYPIQI